jgi:hypothetical protein
VASDQTKVAHPDHFGVSRFIENGYPLYPLFVLFLREVLLDFLDEHKVDAIQDLEVSGEQLAEKVDRPLFHLRLFDVEHRAREGVIHAVPSILPIHIVVVYQQTKHL